MTRANRSLTLKVLEQNTKQVGDCLLWTGGVNNTGHPRYYAANNTSGHVRTWWAKEKLGISLANRDRLGTWCKNKLCLADAHLYRMKDFCTNGHSLVAGSVHRGVYPGTGKRYCRTCKISSGKKGRYGVSTEDIQHLLEEQGYACKICRTPFTDENPYYVDHNHKTLRVRGLLCLTCNTLLGMSGDDPMILEAAILYLVEDATFAQYVNYPTP